MFTLVKTSSTLLYCRPLLALWFSGWSSSFRDNAGASSGGQSYGCINLAAVHSRGGIHYISVYMVEPLEDKLRLQWQLIIVPGRTRPIAGWGSSLPWPSASPVGSAVVWRSSNHHPQHQEGALPSHQVFVPAVVILVIFNRPSSTWYCPRVWGYPPGQPTASP
jgi:hypothetical protein